MIKDYIKKIVSVENRARIRMLVLDIKRLFITNPIQTEYPYFRVKEDKANVFFGYYDITPFSKDENNILYLSVKDGNKIAEVKLYDLNSKKHKILTQTRAWNWQQGSRLRWWPTDDNYVCYNDVIDNEYVCKKININTKKVDSVFCKALYDIDPQGTYGLSLNFSRLQRLRPGYGYDSIKDDTINISSPTKDGIYYVDLLKNESQLIISLKKLAEKCYDKNADQHYINHISISPNGEKFIFFHIWTIKNSDKWKTCLSVSNKKGTELKILERDDLVLHYDWIDSNNVLITGYTKEKKQFFHLNILIKMDTQQ